MDDIMNYQLKKNAITRKMKRIRIKMRQTVRIL